jgi:hypothetical protein
MKKEFKEDWDSLNNKQQRRLAFFLYREAAHERMKSAKKNGFTIDEELFKITKRENLIEGLRWAESNRDFQDIVTTFNYLFENKGQ